MSSAGSSVRPTRWPRSQPSALRSPPPSGTSTPPLAGYLVARRRFAGAFELCAETRARPLGTPPAAQTVSQVNPHRRCLSSARSQRRPRHRHRLRRAVGTWFASFTRCPTLMAGPGVVFWGARAPGAASPEMRNDRPPTRPAVSGSRPHPADPHPEPGCVASTGEAPPGVGVVGVVGVVGIRAVVVVVVRVAVGTIDTS